MSMHRIGTKEGNNRREREWNEPESERLSNRRSVYNKVLMEGLKSRRRALAPSLNGQMKAGTQTFHALTVRVSD